MQKNNFAPGFRLSILDAIILAIGTVATIGLTMVVLVEVRKPSYHGLGWQWINPALPTWWESQLACLEKEQSSNVTAPTGARFDSPGDQPIGRYPSPGSGGQ